MAYQEQRALIVIDVQNEYVSGNLPIEYPEVSLSLANIVRAMDHAQQADIPIIMVQHSAPPGAPIFARGSAGWQLHPEVAARTWQHHIEKRLPDAFAGTDLADWLDVHGISTLTVVGYMTQNCVDSTIRHAFHKGLAVEFLADAAGSAAFCDQAGCASAEEIHRVFSVVMQARFAAVTTTAQWLARLQTREQPTRDDLYASNLRARRAGQT